MHILKKRKIYQQQRIFDFLNYVNFFQWLLGFVPSTYRFLDAFGSVTSQPYINSVILTWQPKRLVGVNPKAKSKRSSS